MMCIGSAFRLWAYPTILVSVLAAASMTQAQELSLGNVNPPKHGTSQASQQFIDKLAELSAAARSRSFIIIPARSAASARSPSKFSSARSISDPSPRPRCRR